MKFGVRQKSSHRFRVKVSHDLFCRELKLHIYTFTRNRWKLFCRDPKLHIYTFTRNRWNLFCWDLKLHIYIFTRNRWKLFCWAPKLHIYTFTRNRWKLVWSDSKLHFYTFTPNRWTKPQISLFAYHKPTYSVLIKELLNEYFHWIWWRYILLRLFLTEIVIFLPDFLQIKCSQCTIEIVTVLYKLDIINIECVP